MLRSLALARRTAIRNTNRTGTDATHTSATHRSIACTHPTATILGGTVHGNAPLRPTCPVHRYSTTTVRTFSSTPNITVTVVPTTMESRTTGTELFPTTITDAPDETILEEGFIPAPLPTPEENRNSVVRLLKELWWRTQQTHNSVNGTTPNGTEAAPELHSGPIIKRTPYHGTKLVGQIGLVELRQLLPLLTTLGPHSGALDRHEWKAIFRLIHSLGGQEGEELALPFYAAFKSQLILQLEHRKFRAMKKRDLAIPHLSPEEIETQSQNFRVDLFALGQRIPFTLTTAIMNVLCLVSPEVAEHELLWMKTSIRALGIRTNEQAWMAVLDGYATRVKTEQDIDVVKQFYKRIPIQAPAAMSAIRRRMEGIMVACAYALASDRDVREMADAASSFAEGDDPAILSPPLLRRVGLSTEAEQQAAEATMATAELNWIRAIGDWGANEGGGSEELTPALAKSTLRTLISHGSLNRSFHLERVWKVVKDALAIDAKRSVVCPDNNEKPLPPLLSESTLVLLLHEFTRMERPSKAKNNVEQLWSAILARARSSDPSTIPSPSLYVAYFVYLFTSKQYHTLSFKQIRGLMREGLREGGKGRWCEKYSIEERSKLATEMYIPQLLHAAAAYGERAERKQQRCQQLIDAYYSLGLIPQAGLYTAWLHVCIDSRDTTLANHIWEQMKARHVQPDHACYSALIRAHITSNLPQAGCAYHVDFIRWLEDILDSMKTGGPHGQAIIFQPEDYSAMAERVWQASNQVKEEEKHGKCFGYKLLTVTACHTLYRLCVCARASTFFKHVPSRWQKLIQEGYYHCIELRRIKLQDKFDREGLTFPDGSKEVIVLYQSEAFKEWWSRHGHKLDREFLLNLPYFPPLLTEADQPEIETIASQTNA